MNGESKGDRLLSKREVVAMVGVSYPTLWSWMRRGDFPRSVRLTDGPCPRVAWFASEVQAWLRSRPRSRLKGDPS